MRITGAVQAWNTRKIITWKALNSKTVEQINCDDNMEGFRHETDDEIVNELLGENEMKIEDDDYKYTAANSKWWYSNSEYVF